MPISLKIIISVLVLVLIGSGAWWFVSLQSPDQNNQPAGEQQNAQPIASENSDVAIEASFNEIDVEINGMAEDAQEIDQSLTP